MTTPNYPQQPGPYGPPPGGQPPQPGPYGQPGQQPPPYTPPGGYPADPYAQPQPPMGQPPMGQPPMGQPPMGPPPMGQPGPYGPPPGGQPPMGGGPMPYPSAPPPKQTSAAGKVIGAIFVIALLVGVGFIVKGVVSGGSSFTEPSAKAGDCANLKGTTVSPVYKKVDCSSPEATYLIGKATKDTTAECPSKDYASYRQSGRRTEDMKLCLIERLEEGKCYEESLGGISMEAMKPVTCPATETENKFSVTSIFKIEKVYKQANGDCGEAAPMNFPEPSPGLTYCIYKVAGK